jgi:site-specific DNA-methyltransferase (adenine-specific)
MAATYHKVRALEIMERLTIPACTKRRSTPISLMTSFDLRHGDCLEGMGQLPDASIDLAVTSPPYNLGIAYSRYSDRQDREGYLDWCHQWAAQIRRLLKPAGSLFLNLGASPSNPLLPHELILRLRDAFVLQNTIHWIKAITIESEQGELVSRGHFKPISSPRYLNDCHEYIFHLTPDGRTPIDRLALGVPYADKSNIARWNHTGGSDRRCRGNTWFIPYKTISRREKDRPHPATFPVQLTEWCIKLHGVTRVETMLDPFLGIGNSAVAAQRGGVKEFIGFEIDEEYLAEAKRRVAGGSRASSRDA